MKYLTVKHIHKDDKTKTKTCITLLLFFFMLAFFKSNIRTASQGKVEMLLFFLILHIFLCKRNKGEKYTVIEDEETKRVLTLVENTSK